MTTSLQLSYRKPKGLLTYSPSNYGRDHGVISDIDIVPRMGRAIMLGNGNAVATDTMPVVSSGNYHAPLVSTFIGPPLPPSRLPVGTVIGGYDGHHVVTRRSNITDKQSVATVTLRKQSSIATSLMGGVMTARECQLFRYDHSLAGQILTMAGGRGYGLTALRQSPDQAIQSSIPTGGCVAAAARLTMARFAGAAAHGKQSSTPKFAGEGFAGASIVTHAHAARLAGNGQVVNDSTLSDAGGAAVAAIYAAIERQFIASVAELSYSDSFRAPVRHYETGDGEWHRVTPRLARAINGSFPGGLPHLAALTGGEHVKVKFNGVVSLAPDCQSLWTIGRLAARNSMSSDGRTGSIRDHVAGGVERTILRLDAPCDDSPNTQHGCITRDKPRTIANSVASLPCGSQLIDGEEPEYLSQFSPARSYGAFSLDDMTAFEAWVCKVAGCSTSVLRLNGLPGKGVRAEALLPGRGIITFTRAEARRARLIVRLVRNVSANHPDATTDAIAYAGYPSQDAARKDLSGAKFWDAMREALPASQPVASQPAKPLRARLIPRTARLIRHSLTLRQSHTWQGNDGHITVWQDSPRLVATMTRLVPAMRRVMGIATRDAMVSSGVGYRPKASKLNRNRAKDWESAKSMLHSRL
jgi:hypothetical protein